MHKTTIMATLSDNPKKMAIVERLVKEGVIDFAEAITLLEKEVVQPVATKPILTEPSKPNHPYQHVIGKGEFPIIPIYEGDILPNRRTPYETTIMKWIEKKL